jgi:hypothetical protein
MSLKNLHRIPVVEKNGSAMEVEAFVNEVG